MNAQPGKKAESSIARWLSFQPREAAISGTSEGSEPLGTHCVRPCAAIIR